MKKMLLVLLLAGSSVAAQAEWTRIAHPSQEFALYIEKDTIVSPGPESVKAWHMVDYVTAQDLGGRSFLSIKAQDEYNCERGMRRDLMHVWHQDNMAGSTMLKAAYKPGMWTAPSAGSIEEVLMRVVCDKK